MLIIAKTFLEKIPPDLKKMQVAIGNNNRKLAYQFAHKMKLNLEITTLTRTTVLTSSNSDNAVDFTSGTKDVFCTLPASKAVYLDA